MDTDESRGGVHPDRGPEPGDGGGAGAEEDDPVMAMVRRQLDRENPPDTKALYGRAIHLDPSVRELTLRQFHAKYPLKIKRERSRRDEG